MSVTTSSFSQFIQHFEATLKKVFHEDHNIDRLSTERGLPAEVLSGIMETVPLSVIIPETFGGRSSPVKDVLTMLSAASYESLPLSLMFGINIGLFLGPVAKYGQDSIKQELFDRFLNHQQMGGMMITEPWHGSDALNMQTAHKAVKQGFHLKGSKHWQGLTGSAEYWLIAGRKQHESGVLGRDVDFFICDTKVPGQQIEVEEYYDDALGLYLIPYGRNKVDVVVPGVQQLVPETTGIKMMLDILHRSRMQFPGMAMGFIKRMLNEALQHCKTRIVGAGNLLAMDQVSFMVSRIQAAYTLCSAMCVRSSAVSGLENNLASEGLEANSIKAVVTDLMQESAQLLLQVSGGSGYRLSHIGGRGIVDSRPFQIFEGSNEMLYTQVAEMITRMMKKQHELHLFDFLKSFALTSEACLHFKEALSFRINTSLSQRKLFDLGRIFGRILSIGYVLELEIKGFRKDLIENCIVTVQQEVAALLASFRFENKVKPVIEYGDDSSWVDFA